MKKTIGIIAGSLRKESFSRKIAAALIAMAPDGFEFKLVSFADLPVFNQDYDDEHAVPQSYTAFRNTIGELDGVIFVTPEYNRSVPGGLKNAIDVASRPYGQSKWDGKPGAVFSNSPGNISGFGANHHLRQVLTFLNMPLMQQPEVYLAGVHNLLDENGHLKDDKAKEFLQQAVEAYVVWFQKTSNNDCAR